MCWWVFSVTETSKASLFDNAEGCLFSLVLPLSFLSFQKRRQGACIRCFLILCTKKRHALYCSYHTSLCTNPVNKVESTSDQRALIKSASCTFESLYITAPSRTTSNCECIVRWINSEFPAWFVCCVLRQMEAEGVWFFTKAACENLMDAQINTQRREVAIQSLQCYNYSSFFLLDKHKGGFYLAPCSHPLSPPLFHLSLHRLASWH